MGMTENTRERGREQAGMTREGRRTMEKVLENTVRDNPCLIFEGEQLFFWLEKYRKVSFRFANRAAQFISAYQQGLTGAEAAWANKRYHGHRTLPAELVAQQQKRKRLII